MEEGEEKRTNKAFDVALAPILPPVHSLPFISSFLAPSGVFPEVSLLLLRASFSYYCEIGFHFPPFFCLFFSWRRFHAASTVHLSKATSKSHELNRIYTFLFLASWRSIRPTPVAAREGDIYPSKGQLPKAYAQPPTPPPPCTTSYKLALQHREKYTERKREIEH